MKLRRFYRNFRDQKGFGVISALLGGLVTVIVGIMYFTVVSSLTKAAANDLPASTTTTTNAAGQATTSAVAGGSSTLSGMLGIIPIVFAVMVLLMVVKTFDFGFGFGHSSDEEETHDTTKDTEPVKFRANSTHTISVVEKASEALLWFQNDLEGILGIKTVVDNHKYFGLDLTGDTLAINEEDYDWYITAKQKDENIFKVVGLHKTEAANNVVYVLGKRGFEDLTDSAKNGPFLIKIPVTRVANEVNVPKHMVSLES